MSGVALVCSITLFFIPSSRQLNVGAPRIFGGLSYVIKDSMFGKMLFGWMLMGLGVIMTIPLRIEYMAGKQGVGISNEQIAMIVILYSFAGIITSYWWGKLFDRMPFVPYRISLNLFLLFSVFVFFNSNSMIGLLIGSVLAGIANGGASIAWSLWVTKLAPVGLESEYMGAHVFMTGLRGFLAPFLGYAVLGQLGFQGVSYVSCGLILCSLIVFLTALKSKRL
jgi:MFS family permease